MTTQQSLLNQIADGIALVRDGMVARYGEKHPEWTWIHGLLADYFDTVRRAKGEGKTVAWVNFGAIPEVFWAMDIVPVVCDGVTGSACMVLPDGASKYIDLAEGVIPDHICGNNKFFVGAAMSGDISIPDMVVQQSSPCDSNLATYPVIAERFGASFFCVDVPYWRDEASFRYVAEEVKRLVSFLEEQTGRKMDFARLQQVMEYSNQAHDHILKLNELREASPYPYSSIETIAEYIPILALAGTPQLADYARRRYELTRDRVERGVGSLPREREKYRLAWIYGALAFDFGIMAWLEREYGAVSVAHMNNNFVMGPVEDLSNMDSVAMGLAHKLVDLPMGRECYGPWETYVGIMIDLCRRYRADAAVFAGHVACKHNWAIIKLVKDRIYDELGIPTLVFECDVYDPRVASSDDIKGKFDEFFETYFE